MATPIENLVAFVTLRRAELGIGQNELARACGIRPGTLSNLLRGRVTKAPSLSTLERLSRGLTVDVDTLVRIARGELADEIARRSRRGAIPAVLARPESGRHPITDEEWRIVRAAERIGMKWHLDEYPRLLEIPPEVRKWIFRDLESLVHSVELHERLDAAQ